MPPRNSSMQSLPLATRRFTPSKPQSSALPTKSKDLKPARLPHRLHPILETNPKYRIHLCSMENENRCYPSAKCRLKFVGQPSSFPTESNKVIYVSSRLEAPPFSWFSPLNDRLQDPKEKDPPELASFDAFDKALKTLYSDPHLALTAEWKIRALRQITSVAHYIAEFEEHCQYLTWNDDALRDQFHLGLKDGIKDNLAPLERPSTLTVLKETGLVNGRVRSEVRPRF